MIHINHHVECMIAAKKPNHRSRFPSRRVEERLANFVALWLKWELLLIILVSYFHYNLVFAILITVGMDRTWLHPFGWCKVRHAITTEMYLWAAWRLHCVVSAPHFLLHTIWSLLSRSLASDVGQQSNLFLILESLPASVFSIGTHYMIGKGSVTGPNSLPPKFLALHSATNCVYAGHAARLQTSNNSRVKEEKKCDVLH